MIDKSSFAQVAVGPVTAEAVDTFCHDIVRLERARGSLGRDPSARAFRDHLDEVHRQLRHAHEELLVQMEHVSEAHAVLEKERARYRDLFDRAPDAQFVTDRLGVIVDLNPAAAKLLGRPAGHARGKPLVVFIARETARNFRAAVGHVTSGQRAEALVQLEVQRATWVRLRGWWDQQSGRASWMATEEVREEASPARVSSSPPPSSEPAPSSAEWVMAALSHELRGPMQAGMGWTKLLLRDEVPEKQRAMALEVIERSFALQASILDGLLDASRLGSHGVGLELAPVDWAASLKLAVDGALPRARQVGVELHAELVPGTFVLGDSVRLTQIAMNLVANALKFTPAGGRVIVRLESTKPYALLSVIDSGEGIRREALDKIFDCFAQDCAPTKARSGIGLGLFLVRKFVELHSGRVSASSEGPGCGSTFEIRLPLLDAPHT